MREILFEKEFDNISCAGIAFCGPSDKDKSFAFVVDCSECTNEMHIVLSENEIIELHDSLGKAKTLIENKTEIKNSDTETATTICDNSLCHNWTHQGCKRTKECEWMHE
jgi:hypothetical protein